LKLLTAVINKWGAFDSPSVTLLLASDGVWDSGGTRLAPQLKFHNFYKEDCKVNYWEECISEAFDDAGIIATEEQIKNVAGWVASAHENYGMAHGRDCIPNPLLSEIDQLKRKMRKSEDDYERQIRGIKKGVAERRKVDISDVSIDDDGLVAYRPR